MRARCTSATVAPAAPGTRHLAPAPVAMHALATDDLTKDYAVGFWRKRPYRALDRLSLEVEQGEVFGFLGPNGAGKTTTLKLLMQLVYPTSGRAEILGRPVGDLSVKQRLGYLPENPYFYDYLTAEELLSYFAGLFGYSAADRRVRVSGCSTKWASAASGSSSCASSPRACCSASASRRRSSTIRSVVIFDEPMSGLDPLGRRDVRALILRLRDRGCTVFFSSHVLSDAEALCSRVAILAKGRLMKSGRLSDMLDLQAHGWELVVASVSDPLARALETQARRLTRISEGRYTVELPLDPPPDRVVSDVAAGGGTVDLAQPAPRDPRRPLRRTGGEVGRRSVKTIAWIALNVFRESVRDKVLYNLVLFAILMMGASYLLGQLTAGQDYKIVIDLGLGAMSVFGLFIAVFIGIGLVSKEVERKSIYALLAKPIHRYQLVLGKYAGLIITLLVNISIMAVGLYLVMYYVASQFPPEFIAASDVPPGDPRILKAVVLIVVELAVVTAIALFFSTFSTPIMSAAFTFALWVAGHFSADLRNFEQVVESPMAARIARGLYWVLPNLARFDVKGQVVHGQTIEAGLMALAIAYGGLYIAVLLVAAVTHFLAPRFQVTRLRSFSVIGIAVAAIVALMTVAVRVQRELDGAVSPARDGGGDVVSDVRRRAAAAVARLSVARGRPLLDSGDSAFREHSSAARHPRSGSECAARGGTTVRSPLSAPGADDDARPVFLGGLPVRGDFSGRAVPRRAGTARSGGCPARKGIGD